MVASGPAMRLKPRRDFCRVDAPHHLLHTRIVEFSGHGHGFDVYAIADGQEWVFRVDELIGLVEEARR